MKKWLCALLVCLLAALPLWALAEETYDADILLTTGDNIRLSDLRGKIVILSMWATWCPGCVAEMPILQQIQDDFSGDVTVLAANQGETAHTVISYLEEKGYTFAAAVDEWSYLLTNVFPSDYIPYLVVLDGAGHKIYDQIGSNAQLYDTLAQLIEENSPFRTAQVVLPGDAQEGQIAMARGTVNSAAGRGFLMRLSDGTLLSCLWAGETPEIGAEIEAAGDMVGGSLNVTGLRNAEP